MILILWMFDLSVLQPYVKISYLRSDFGGVNPEKSEW